MKPRRSFRHERIFDEWLRRYGSRYLAAGELVPFTDFLEQAERGEIEGLEPHELEDDPQEATP